MAGNSPMFWIPRGMNNPNHNRISFAARLLSVMRLEEKHRCEGNKGQFQCFNVARITFTGCRHSTCFGKRLQLIAKFNDAPTCPTQRSSNRLTKLKLREFRVFCSSHGNEQTTKLMYIPIVCTFAYD
uniref:Uncharacterized protein n=1 Tax=Panagrolaimus davidi TaxID=227884 RepID=A0A914QMR2_9BILA